MCACIWMRWLVDALACGCVGLWMRWLALLTSFCLALTMPIISSLLHGHNIVADQRAVLPSKVCVHV